MDGITIGRLRYLHEVVSRAGVRKAADHLGVAPSSVSRQLAQLEHSARMPLLEPDRRVIKPTEAGKLLLDYYTGYIARRETLAARLAGLQAGDDGHVEIGLVQGLAGGLMRDALYRLHERHPALTVSLRLGGMDDIVQWLEQDAIHLGITYGPPLDTRLAQVKKAISVTRPMCAVVPPGHALASLRDVCVDALLPYAFALAGSAYGTRKIMQQIEREEACTFQLLLETNHLIGLQNFVVASLGVTVLPAFAVQNELDQGKLAALPVAHALARRAQMQLLVRPGRALPESAQALQRLLTRQLRGRQA
ncbi:LysR family transcriptional regulator [Paraburkholderia sp. A2RI-6]|uniref:LysR family transcriptional regulator n=1 Tax=Paraburkholderia sp. A2RI-6 TaxID=3028371 RepID=UPI003B7625C5